MRFYQTFPIALNEIRRELKEMGLLIHTKSVQNIVGDIEAYELQFYQYRVENAFYMDIPVKNLDWCQAEFKERVSGLMMNPGAAWELRKPYWKQFINAFGKFDYAYPERITPNLEHVINALRKDIFTRRAFLPILGLQDDADDFKVRFPCSIGYHFLFRQEKLDMQYQLRSSDYFEHLANDLWLANRLQHYVADQLGVKSGVFYHSVGSLHCFTRDVKEVF